MSRSIESGVRVLVLDGGKAVLRLLILAPDRRPITVNLKAPTFWVFLGQTKLGLLVRVGGGSMVLLLHVRADLSG